MTARPAESDSAARRFACLGVASQKKSYSELLLTNQCRSGFWSEFLEAAVVTGCRNVSVRLMLARLCLQPTGACTIDIVAVLFRFTLSSDNQWRSRTISVPNIKPTARRQLGTETGRKVSPSRNGEGDFMCSIVC